MGFSQGTIAETEGHCFLLITDMFPMDVPLWCLSSFLLRNYRHNLQAMGTVANVALHFLSLALSLSLETKCSTTVVNLVWPWGWENGMMWAMGAKYPVPVLKHTQTFKCFTYLILNSNFRRNIHQTGHKSSPKTGAINTNVKKLQSKIILFWQGLQMRWQQGK